MRKMLWLLLLLVGLGGSASAQSYEKIQLYCEKGGETVITDGRTSTTRVQRSYPSCTVTVYDGGTLTLASIASDSIGTPKSNPFTADSDGYISFYATDGTYDVKMSGSGLAAPITRSGFWVITSAGGGGGISGSGTTNRFPIFTSSSAIGNSVFQQVGTSEFAPAATGKRINLGTGSQQVVEIANAAVTGTTQNRLAKLTGAPSTAVIATTTDTTKLVGVVIAGAGTTGNAQIVTNGNVSCEFDGATTAGNYVGASTTTNGKCTDLGASLPVSGVQVIGRVLETIGSAGNATVFIFTGEQGRGGTTGSGTTAYLAYWTGTTALGATGVLYDTLNNIYQFAGNLDIANGGLSELTLETDQIIFKGGVIRANNAVMQTMKATATQTGDFQRFTTSAGSARFRVDIDGDVLPRGVNYTWPATLPASTGCLQITSAGVMSVVSCVSGTGVRYALNVKEAPYSCVGDGVTDDTTCFQDAINDAALAGGYIVYAPAATYKVTGLSVPGGVTLDGDGREKTIIYSTTDAVIVDAITGTGSYAFKGPELRNFQIKGSNSAGDTSQIGLNIDDALYFYGMDVQNLAITQTGSHGVYFGKIFSSVFKNITSGASAGGYPFLFNQINMPGNTFEGLYAGDVNSTSPAGFRIRTGNITCWGCNGINNSSANSWWAIVGDKVGTDGALTNRQAYFTCNDCNIESSKAGGILHYYNSTSELGGRTEFTGDGGSSGTYIALKYEIDTGGGLIPSDFPKGNLGPLVVFTNSPLAYYANSEVIHANDLPPVTVAGQVRQADGTIITSYRNTTNSRSEKIYRTDAAKPVVTITSSTNYTQPGATNYEANCAAPCTLTLPWPGFWNSNEQLIYIRNIGAGALTLAANSGGSFNGGAGPTLAQNESIVYIPHTASADYRQVGLAGGGAANRITYYSAIQNLTSSANLTYDGTTVLNQRAGGNPYFAANDTTNGISTRFGPLAGAPDRAIVGTSSNHPFGLWTNATEKWTVGISGDFTPGAASSYSLGSASLPILDATLSGKLFWNGSSVFDNYGTGSPEGVVTASIGSVYRRTNGSTGTTLYIKESGSGNTGWTAVASAASIPLTATYVGYGNGSNVLTGTSDFAYSTSTKTLSIVNGSGASTLVLNGSSDTSAVKFGAASLPGTQGGIFFPFVGGGMSNGPGIWWGSSASYSSLSGIYLNNGFTFQGANSTHDPVKIAKSTGTSSTGTTIFEFRPSDAYFALSPFGTSTGETTPIRFLELAASGSDYVALKAPDALAAPITLTLPATLPASAGCLQVSSTGVITQTGSACGAGGGSVEWQAITNPTGNAALSMAAFTTSWTWNAATGASNLFTLTDTASNTGTGYIASISTAASSSAKPIRITAGGTANGVEMTTAGVLAAIGAGEIRATTANPSASIGLTANNGSATSAMRSDATPALSQAIAPTWTGLHTYNPGTTPSNVLLFDIAAIGSTGTRDSHNFVMRGRSDNGSAHTVEWKQFVDVTSNAGASQWVLQSNLDGGLFSNWLTIADSGLITGGNFLGANFTTAGGAVLDDDVNAVTGFTVNGVATNGTILRADGTRYAASSFTLAAPGTAGHVLTSDGTNWISSAPTSGGLGDPGANGIVVRTALNTTTARTITGTANKITVTDGNGVSGNPTLTLPTLLNVDDVELSSGSAIATGTTNGNTFNLAAYDVDGATYTDLLRLTAGNTPAISFVLGSDATGDIWYRNSGGAITRLPVGSSGQVLTVSGGLPSWQDNIPVIAFSDLSSSIANVTFSQSTFNTTFNYTTGLQAASWSGNTSTSNAFSLSHSNTSATGSLLNLSTSASVSVRPLTISPRGNQSFQADHLGNIVIGNAALATSATDGFLYLPSSAGVPTGTPTSYTGRVPVEVDTTNSRLYGYIGSAWVNLTGSGGGGLGDPGANGVVVRTALDTTTARTITAGSSNGLSVTDGDGVSGNPTVDFSTTNTSGLGFHLPGNGGLPFVTDSSSALAGSANEVRVALFYAPGRITVDRIGVNGVTDSASNNAGFGIYSSDGNTKICDSGAISTTSWSGAASYTLSASCTFGPGYFYYAWTASSTTPTARSAAAITNFYAPLNTGSGTVLGTAANTSSAGVLPTTLGALTDSNSLAVPIVRWFKN